MRLPLPLEQYSPRALNFIGSLIYGQDARVVLSQRIKAVSVVALESRTVLLDPERANLYDLCLAARLLRWRAQGRTERGRKDRVPLKRLRGWLREAEESLLQDYRGIRRLAGRYSFAERETWPQVVWSQVEYKPLDAQFPGDLALRRLPGVEITCPQDDYAWLLEALRQGRIPLEYVPELRELPVATFPLTISFSQAHGPKFEQLERHLNEFKDSIPALVNCYRRKSEGLLDMNPLGKRTTSSLRLDATRLVDAVLARRVGRQPKLFQQRRSTFQPIFDPRQHFVILAVDFNGLKPGPIGDPGFSERMLAIFIKVFQTLGVDFAVLGFSDHILDLAEGQRVYVHVPVLLKGIDEDFDGAFWSRLAHVLEAPPRLPGLPACCHSLVLRSVGRMWDQVAEDAKHSYRALILATKRGMPWELSEFHTDEFLSRLANKMDDLIGGWHQRFEGVIDTLGSYIPEELKHHGKRGGYVAQMF